MRTTSMAAGLVAAAALSGLACVTHAVIDPAVLPAPLLAGATQSVAVSGDSYVAAGEVHEGDLVTIMGDARVDGEVTGQVVVVLGRLEMNGSARGQVVSVLSDTVIGPQARIGGDLLNIGWLMKREHGSEVGGEVINVGFMQFMPFVHEVGGLTGLVWFIVLVQLAILAAFFVAVLLITALIPRRLDRIAAAFPEKWGWGLLAGVLGYAGTAVAAFILVCTLIGIPLALALGFALTVTKWVGLVSIFLLTGQTLGRNLFRRELTHFPAVLGGFVLYAVLWMLPVFGWVISNILDFLAAGIVLVTKFGAEQPWGAAPQSPRAGQQPAGPAHATAAPAPAAPPIVPSAGAPGSNLGESRGDSPGNRPGGASGF